MSISVCSRKVDLNDESIYEALRAAKNEMEDEYEHANIKEEINVNIPFDTPSIILV